jgi:glycine oxidase
MHDCLILGGGVIGLSLAYDLAGHGLSVQVIDRGLPGEESSWAGAGILPPGVLRSDVPAYEQLAELCHQLHPLWAQQLRDETGVDSGYRRCGGWYLTFDESEKHDTRAAASQWRERGVSVEECTPARLREAEPALDRRLCDTAGGYFLPEESQVRNPRHLKALLRACALRGVTIQSGVEALDFVVESGRIQAVRTSVGALSAETVCIASGAWSRGLVDRLGVEAAIRPVRGQMVLLADFREPLASVVNVGHRYLVPRFDGRVLIGSTEEEAGFDKRTTGSGIQSLLDFAIEIVPALASARFDRCWAGLRPATVDGLPYLGRLPGVANGFVAAGHFRSGLQLSPGTAVLMSQLMRGLEAKIDLTPFSPERAIVAYGD